MLRLAAIAAGQGPEADIEAWDELVIRTLIGREVALAGSPIEGRSPDEILAALGERRGPERLVDFMLRVGPFGDGFGADPDGLTLERLEANPHGLDFGAMRPRIPEVLRTPSGKIELAPDGDRRRRAAPRGRARRPRQRRHGADRPPPAALEQLVDAQPAGAGQGQGPLHGPGQPVDAERLGLADGGHAARVAPPPASSSPRSRSPTRSCPASSRSPTAGATTPPASASGVAVRARRGELEPARPRRGRRALRQRGPQRDPGRGRRGRPRAERRRRLGRADRPRSPERRRPRPLD